VQATATCTIATTSASTIGSGGTGYTVGDTLTVSGGVFTSAATFTVATVSAGVITGLTFVQGGFYTTFPSNPAATTGGTGSGATINLNAGVLQSTFTITNAGSGYVEQPTVTFSGGGGSGAAAYARIGSDVTVKGLGTNLDFNTPNGTGLRVLDGGQTSAAYWSVGGGTNAVFRTVGNAAAYFDNNNAQPIIFRTATSSEQFRVSHTASAVNYVQVTGAATGGRPVISAQGSDANAGLWFQAKGTGNIRFDTRTGASIGFLIADSGSAVNANWAQVAGAATGSAPVFSVAGTDTNIDLTLTPKGTGNVRFGTFTSNADTAITGYITIKDSGGTVRKLAVIA
jgi:hypothetical protein